jgi:hypothetical protein
MTTIHIKKIRSANQDAYAVPCMAISTPEGRLLIPNPNGTEARVFNTLEEAGEAAHRAGFDFQYEGETKHLPVQGRGPAMSTSISSARPLEDCQPRLIQLLGDREPSVVSNSAAALGALHATQALEELSKCLGHDDPSVRRNAAEAIAKMGAPALHTLREAMGRGRVMTHSNALYIRLSVLMAYSEMIDLGLDRAAMNHFLPQVVECLDDESWLVRAQAALVLTHAANSLDRQANR